MSEHGTTFMDTELRASNRRLNNWEYDQGLVELKSRPLALFIELTKNCNLYCPMCRPRLKYDHAWNMHVEMYEKIADELFPYASLIDLRGWGESLLVRELNHFVKVALTYRSQLRIVTNGQVNRPDIWELLMAAHGIIAVSCDAATNSLFAELRAGGTLPRLRDTVKDIVVQRDRFGAPRDSVFLTGVISRTNLRELEGLIELAAELDLSKVIFFPVQSNHGAEGDAEWTLEPAEEAVEEWCSRAFERGRREGIEVQLGAAPTEGLALQDLVKQAPCMHPWSYAYVSYQGDVGFCDHLIGEQKYVFESLQNKSFDEIWNGKDFVELRSSHLTGRLPERFSDCRWCYKQRYVDFEDLFHDKYKSRKVSTKVSLDLLRRPPKSGNGAV